MRSFARVSDLGDIVLSSLLVRAALGYEDALFASRLPREEWGADGIALINAAIGSLDADHASVEARLLAAQGRALAYGGQLQAGAQALRGRHRSSRAFRRRRRTRLSDRVAARDTDASG